jgi:S1-C subfamily serine protease
MRTFEQFPGRTGRGFSGPLPMILAGAAFVMAGWLLLLQGGWLRPEAVASPRAVTPRGELAELEQTIIDVFARTSPSVAHITTRAQSYAPWGATTQEGTGSGFVWDDSGTVVTNFHVVEGASSLSVAIAEQTFSARILRAAPEFDLAILQLQGDTSGLRPIPLGTSADLQVGQMAIAIGNPFGFDQTLTTGIISALGRNIRAGDENSRDGRVLSGLIQVDAAINPGNSGGPLLDSAGRLIGVTTAIYSPSGANAGIGFAVPVDTVNEVVPALIAAAAEQPTAAAGRPVLGVYNDFTDPRLRTCRLGRGFDYDRGAIITMTIEGSGAAAAGLRAFRFDSDYRVQRWGDVIVAIDDFRVREFNDIGPALRGRRPGELVTVTVVRGLPDRAAVEKLQVTLGAANG